jgi:RAQPRD family integrative conjugative element protein
MQIIITIAISLFIASSALAAPLIEREELTLYLNQLSQIEASLQQATQSSRTGIKER